MSPTASEQQEQFIKRQIDKLLCDDVDGMSVECTTILDGEVLPLEVFHRDRWWRLVSYTTDERGTAVYTAGENLSG